MRGKQAPKRDIKPDPVYNSVLVSKFINYLMLDGKKAVATKVVYQALEELGAKTKMAPLEALDRVIANVQPRLEVRSRRVGGSNYQVPVPVRGERQLALALKWMIAAARNTRGSKDTWESLAKELIAAFNNEGSAIKKKEDVERMAEANRAFAQFAW